MLLPGGRVRSHDALDEKSAVVEPMLTPGTLDVRTESPRGPFVEFCRPTVWTFPVFECLRNVIGVVEIRDPTRLARCSQWSNDSREDRANTVTWPYFQNKEGRN